MFVIFTVYILYSILRGILRVFLVILCSLVIWYDLLCEINVTSKLLQSISLNIIESINKINNTKIFLQKYRSDENVEKILKQTSNLAN